MVRITIKHTKVGGVKKRINEIEKYLKNDVAKEAYANSEKTIQSKWQREIPNVFGVRRSQGYRCDGILAKSLAIVRRGKNDVIVYVEPIIRYSKNATSSGGAVNNLTSILFYGSKASFGKYNPRWDARVQTGMHPGTSPSTMRNYWKKFKSYAVEQIRRGINQSMKKMIAAGRRK